ncbi:hypothetical protein LZ24_03193 [Desulfobotulus alkaliphilus]|uniref:Uncharacterized protein n=1 Tax=Desulfobotulus alkaliphilus TaxID=622671 RepID=A0A562R4G9_9BACT|nr:hypothetical protein [Desulfobotulus alkaliphilus]TWI63941.1 hypothetical protein LZ24_03193 [Desulfobotulus alkaliphilus]
MKNLFKCLIKKRQMTFILISLMLCSGAWGECPPYKDYCWRPEEGCPYSNQQLQQMASCCIIYNIESDALNRWQKWNIRYEARDSGNYIIYKCSNIDSHQGIFDFINVRRNVKCSQIDFNNNNTGKKVSGAEVKTYIHTDGGSHEFYCGYLWDYFKISVR